MGLFQKLFKRQPGGSIVGNLLRGVGDKFTGGAISKIFRPPATEQELALQEIAKGGVPQNTGIATQLQQLVAPLPPVPVSSTKKNMPYYIGGAAAVLALLWYILKPKKRGKSW